MANHIASISSSSRAIRQHEALESSRQESALAESGSALDQTETPVERSTTSELTRMSVMSLSDDESLASKSSAKSRRSRKKRASGGGSLVVKPDLLSTKLSRLDAIIDIDSNFDDENLHHSNVLQRMEQKWSEISKNLDSTMKHLEECSQQVTESSSNCLQALLDSVGTTCDNVDGELKILNARQLARNDSTCANCQAFYHLMTKCDELTTKLSIATSFRDEIKTLRKSVETLEQLYKNKPPPTLRQPSHRGGESNDNARIEPAQSRTRQVN